MERSRQDAEPGVDEPTKSHRTDLDASDAPALRGGDGPGRPRRNVHVVPRILLVHAASDSPEVMSVRRLLRELPEPPHVEEAGSLAAARDRLAKPPPPDLVLVDGSRSVEGLQTLGDPRRRLAHLCGCSSCPTAAMASMRPARPVVWTTIWTLETSICTHSRVC